MSDVKKKNERADGLSRRSFLGVGSAVLATATSVGLTADARDDARKIEGDHASSNPGQENKPEFQDVSLNNWLRRLPAEIVTAPLNLDGTTIVKIPAEKLEVI